MQIHDLNTKALTDPAYVAFDDGTDTYKTEFNDVVADAAAAAVADADLTDNTVAFTSGDAASPTAWTAVDVLTSGLPLKTLFNRISTMVKNVRYIWNLLGSSSFSNVASTLSGAIGNTALTTTAQTLSGAIAEHESDISTLNSNTVPKPLTIVKASSNYTINKGFAYRIGRLVVFSVQLTSNVQIPTGQGLFRLDYEPNKSVAPSIDTTGVGTLTWAMGLIFGTTHSVTTTAKSGGHVYIASAATIPANTGIYTYGTFISDSI